MQKLSNLPVGAKVKFGKYSVNGETPERIEWILVKHGAYVHAMNENLVTSCTFLLAKHIIDLRAFDAQELYTMGSVVKDRSNYGNSNYMWSNIASWLSSDKPAGQWFSNQGSYDQSPTNERVTDGTGYDTRPGFLNAFTTEEKAMIVFGRLDVGIPPYEQTEEGGEFEGEGEYSNRYAFKVFLPSYWDLYGGLTPGQEPWTYFKDGERRATLSAQAYANSPSATKPTSQSEYWHYWLTNPYGNYSARTQSATSKNETGSAHAYTGSVGIRPAVRLADSVQVSDTVDEDGCYVVISYELINPPATIVVPSITEGVPHTVGWSVPTNIQSALGSVCYKVEWAYDGGTFDNHEVVSETSVSRTVESGHSSIQYRVSAAYTSDMVFGTPSYSNVVTIINNAPPIISGKDESLGTMRGEFSYSYSVTDNDALDAGNITVEEAMDGNLINSYSAEQGVVRKFNVFGNDWLKLTNGSHTITITALDKRGTRSVRTIEFVKEVTTLSIETYPMESISMPVCLSFFVSRKLPDEAIYKVEVCNNAFDAEPTWEDATTFSDGENIYVFENKSKTADSWGLAVRVFVDRNGGEGECYINSIGGNFE